MEAEQERDSYDIYSMLLRDEVGPEWNITTWLISEQTQTYPTYGEGRHNVRQCLTFPGDQESDYLPLIEDYAAKNREKRILERKFDLPQYVLVGAAGTTLGGTPMLFEVSAVGFNKDRTRALVYVGHHCGSLCGGGGYHLLVKVQGKWQVDSKVMSCRWVS